jgi:hypothetical protein
VANLVSSGRLGAVQFLIVPNDTDHQEEHNTEYDVTVTTPIEVLKTKCTCWRAARTWVERIAKQTDERQDEIDRNY